jgi:transcriptional regulator with XRE-family HTH domain
MSWARKMTQSLPKKSKLSAIAQRIADLIDTVGGGSQRAFAAKIKCSQPVLSRIVNGQQQPGRDLIERIAQLDGVDKESLLESLDDAHRADNTGELLIPVTQCLLPSFSANHRELATANTLAVPNSLYRPTLYAVPARMCEPAYSDPSERLRPDDLIVIESATERFQRNLSMLSGRLCAVLMRDDTGDSLTLRRVWVRFDSDLGSRQVITCSDAKVGAFRERKFGKKLLRSIQLDPPEQLPEAGDAAELIDQPIDVSAITGLAVQLIRNL